MAKKDFLKKSKSFYSLKDIHTTTNKGLVYENDYVTILNNDDIYNEDIPLFSDSIFKFRIGISDDSKKRYVRDRWSKNDDGDITWTKEDIRDNIISDESKIVLKPNYNSLKDFAYYGSAVAMVKAAINDIILHFPGGLYYYDKKYAPKVLVNGKNYYVISNECKIDCWSKGITSVKEGDNPLRYLSYSYKDYGLNFEPEINITGDCVDSIIGTIKINNSLFYIYKDAKSQNHLLSETNGKGVIIEPKKEIIKNFWDSLDDFEKILLNKETTPKYTAWFETPYKDETGFYYEKKAYTWPTIADSNTPDLTTSKFKGYIESLMSLAEFHDEYDSDNIWRMMTHESIKNLDWTFKSNNDDMSDIDDGKMKALIHVQGRLYDDIKRSIDNIKYNNNLSYNQINNVPDYFLSDVIENDGWDAKNILINPGNTPVIKYDKTIIYSEKNIENVNSEFLRRLALSSNYIFRMKGTRKGIEAILGMFGYIYGKEYEITEYVARTSKSFNDFPDYDEFVCLRANFDYINGGENVNFIKGYPVAIVDDNGKYKLIPWYDNDEKYDDNFYFQSKGGWGRTDDFEVDNSILSDTTTIQYENTYKETEPYMLFVNDLYALTELPNGKLKNGIICYVSNIDNNFQSNFFKLKDKTKSTKLNEGWENVSSTNPEVLYLETIIHNYKGNNPHTGKGDYDMGNIYLDKYENLFREAVKDGKITQTQADSIGANFGKISIIDDNEKCKIVNFDNKNSITIKESYRYLNIKKLTINFIINGNKDFKRFIKTIVMPYLELMVPTTSIFEITFDKK